MSTQSNRPLLPPLDSAPGPAAEIPTARAAGIVDAVLREHGLGEPTGESGRGGGASRFGRTGWQVAAGAAVVLGVAGAVMAAYEYLTHGEPVPTRGAPPAREPSTSSGGEGRRLTPAMPAAPAAGELPARVAVEPAPESADAVAQSPQPRAPEDLLRLANELRAGRRWRAAEQMYVRVRREYGSAPQAYPATIAAAALRLEHLGDPRGALRLFRAALAAKPGGPLALEARQGIADCHRALGDAASEAQALRELLASHPGSALGPRAEARLRELSSQEP